MNVRHHIIHSIQLPATLRPVRAELHRLGFAVLERDGHLGADAPLWILADGCERAWGVRPLANDVFAIVLPDGRPATGEGWLDCPTTAREVGASIEVLEMRRQRAKAAEVVPMMSADEELETLSDWADAQAARAEKGDF
ncbi:hypothetical protein CR162_21225 [Pseudoroseomonas rhizosphaerae]|uniref:Uncharacterized protein n=1 Tax=Teichococcus rhizosphaerae TaxID=1335062 RepID=A0A2C7A7D7_9PROT|nr:hypothetical protein [Pseudoroseomonas rhizosphaerae]PHK92956.1 hypothetical protein CR162_21225 [Pseudoroseomonas rhizosphaerae]